MQILCLLRHYPVVGIANVASSERVEGGEEKSFDWCGRTPVRINGSPKQKLVWVPAWKVNHPMLDRLCLCGID